jgi:hypothetical protein
MILPNNLVPSLKALMWPMFKTIVKQAFRAALLLAVSLAPVASSSAADTSVVLRLTPKKPTSASETHASMVLSSGRLSGAYSITGRAKVVAQLRASPNAWEVAWILWNYQDDSHFYYFTLKGIGWELGKRDPRYSGGQRFLATGATPALSIGQWYRFDVAVIGSQMMLSIDGSPVAIFCDTEAPLYTSGRIGLYTEDADVRFTAITAPDVSRFGPSVPSLSEEKTFGDWVLAYKGYGLAAVMAEQ